MTRDLRLGVLAGFVAIFPGLLLVLLGVPDVFAVIGSMASGVTVLAALGRRWHRQATAAREAQTVHLRGVIGVAATSDGIPTYWTEHSIAPETLILVQQLITALGVRQILELGSGLSTLMIAHSLMRANHGGHVLSLDDDERWAASTSTSLKHEKLDALAEVRVAPLREINSGGRHALWYDLSGLDKQARFDLIVVDGPPAWKGDHLARLPALYELRRHMSDSGVLVLDDAARGGEREIAERWQRDFPELHYRMLGIGRGLFVASVEKCALDVLPP
jgi:predicted O-methyltransferase YrrM